MTLASNDPKPWLSALENSHGRLRGLVDPMGPAEVRGQAYPTEWSVAQVLSHLGSSVVVFGLYVEAGVAGEPPAGMDRIRPIWDTWNAKAPEDQVADGLAADRAFLDRVASLAETELAGWHLDLFGTETSLAGVLRLRVAEHAIHTWDVAVVVDPSATVAQDSVDLVIDDLGGLARRIGVPHEPSRIHLRTTSPDREFLLDLGETVDVRPWDDGTQDGEITLPGEALLRLVYGRLDANHAAGVTAVDVDLDDLRRTFPGV